MEIFLKIFFVLMIGVSSFHLGILIYIFYIERSEIIFTIGNSQKPFTLTSTEESTTQDVTSTTQKITTTEQTTTSSSPNKTTTEIPTTTTSIDTTTENITTTSSSPDSTTEDPETTTNPYPTTTQSTTEFPSTTNAPISTTTPSPKPHNGLWIAIGCVVTLIVILGLTCAGIKILHNRAINYVPINS